jgi:gluconokinase
MGPQVVVAGVSGAGKSTVGAALASRLGVPFVDADSLHSPDNVAKMAGGIPLTDADRQPWLQGIAVMLRENESAGLTMACSALKRSYRDAIRGVAPLTFFVVLTGSRQVLAQRMSVRADHFMPSHLLDSQLAAFEALQPDERGVTLSSENDLEAVVDDALSAILHNR